MIYRSEAEALVDFSNFISRLRAGEEAVIYSESVALAEAHAKELGYAPSMDDDFKADMAEVIALRGIQPRRQHDWD